MSVRKLFLLFSVAAPLLASVACTAPTDEDDDGDFEDEPQAEANDELRSAVSCKVTSATAYKAGSAFSIQVIHVGGKPVSRPTGHAFLRMQEAADKAGVRLSVTSGFRTQAEQTRLYNCYRNGNCNNGNLAAKPGFSNHQSGAALDLSTSSWLAKNAGRFGFVRTVSSEPWHYEFRGSDPGGPCSRTGSDDDGAPATSEDDGLPAAGKLKWVSPAQNGSAENGFTVKAHSTASQITKVVYSQGTFVFGESSSASTDFGLSYTFKYTGDKTLTVKGYDASGSLLAVDHVDFTLNP